MTSKTHRQATDLFAATYILTTGATAVDALIISAISSGHFKWGHLRFSGAATWPDDLEPDGTFGVREHHGFFKRRWIMLWRRLAPWLYKHRGWSHYLITGFIIALVPALLIRELSPILAADVFRGILIGHWAHCLEDASTISGAPLFGPFYKKDIHLMPPGYRFNTNGPSDAVFRWSVVVLILVIVYLYAKSATSPGHEWPGLVKLLPIQGGG